MIAALLLHTVTSIYRERGLGNQQQLPCVSQICISNLKMGRFPHNSKWLKYCIIIVILTLTLYT